MAVRQDEVQLRIDFITDESKQLAKTLVDTKAYTAEIEKSTAQIARYKKELDKANTSEQKRVELLDKIAKEEANVATNLKKVADAGKQVEKIDLSKVAPAQLVERARQLEKALRLIPQSAPEFRKLQAELRGVNTQLASVRAASKGVSEAGTPAFNALSTGAKGFITSLGPIALAIAGITSAFDAVRKLFNIGQDAEALQIKMGAVFGESTAIVQDFAEKNAALIGLSRREYQGLATDVGDLLTPMGFTREEAAKLSVELVNQAGALSRWTKGKVDTAQATEILNKAMLGEREALNSLGIDIKQSLVNDELKRQGLDKLEGAALRQAEALVTLKLATEQSSNANQGFANRTNDLAEKKARLRARISEIADRLGKGLIPVFDKVVGAIVPVVEWVISFGTRLGEAWQKAETFRAIVSGAFTGIGNVIGGVAKGIAGISEGFLNLFGGDFSKAFDNFSTAFANLNPVGVGANLKDGFVQGWDSVKNPQLTVDTTGAVQQQAQLQSALNGQYDNMLAGIKQKNKATGKELQELQEKAFEADLKRVDNQIKVSELMQANRLNRGVISEEQYNTRIAQIQEDGYRAQLAIYQRFGKEKEAEALEIQNKLATIETSRALRANSPAAPDLLPTAGLPSSVSSTGQAGALSAAGLNAGIRANALKQAFEAALITEGEYNVASLELKKAHLDAEIAIMKQSTVYQTDEINKRETEKRDIEAKIDQERLANQRRTEEMRQAVIEQGMDTISAGIELGITLLDKDAEARKQYAGIIKAFQIGEVATAGITEIQKIYAKNAALPGGFLLSLAEAAPAAIRTTAAIVKISRQKFASGGYTGAGYGSADSTGYRPAGVVHEGEYVAPKWQVEHPVYGRVINWLEGMRVKGYATGGFVNVNTTPAPSAAVSSNTAGLESSITRFEQTVSRFEAVVASFPREVRGKWVYQDLSKVEIDAAKVYTKASI